MFCSKENKMEKMRLLKGLLKACLSKRKNLSHYPLSGGRFFTVDIFVWLRAIIATNEPNDFLLGGVKPQLKKSHQPISTR